MLVILALALIVPLPAPGSPPETLVPAGVAAAASFAAQLRPAPAREPAPRKPAAPAGRPASEAERITKLRRAIEADEAALAELAAAQDDPEGEYAQARADFEATDEKHQAAVKRLGQLEEDGRAEDVEALANEVRGLEIVRGLAKERFDLAIEERKVLRDRITTLGEKLAQERAALAELTGDSPAPKPEPAPAGPEAVATAPAPQPAQATKPAQATAPAAAPGPPTTPVSTTPLPVAPGLPVPAAAPAAEPAPAEAPAPKKPAAIRKELLDAQSDAQAKADRARAAEESAQAIQERIDVLDRTIAQERQLLVNAQRMADNAQATRAAVAQEMEAKSVGGATPGELRDLVARLRASDARFLEARAAVRGRTSRLDELQTDRAAMQVELFAAIRAQEEARHQLELAGKAIERLQNPFAPMNLLRWALDHGPNLAAILAGMIAFQAVSRVVGRRIIQVMGRNGFWGTQEEREARAHTLVGVFQNAASVAAIAGGTLMLFQEVGIPIAPLMGGAAVVGLAVAFGAQNLIRDYFYGFVILLENQYKYNDVVKIGEISGQVEMITLRMTVLRDLEGRAHFLPNGAITSVTNFTHGWSRALFELRIAYKEDADHVMSVIQDLGRELRRDPIYGHLILEDLTMLGVDGFAESALMLKFFIKTRPLQQWTVKRELLRRIKRRFDELGIEIPFTHRTVYHRLDAPADLPEILAGGPHARPNVRVDRGG